jgi:hypothetical protein
MTRRRPPTIRSLEPSLRCPDRRCRRLVFSVDAEIGSLAVKCEAPRCGAHWWATRLQAGDVRAQLLVDFEENEYLVDSLMTLFDLPQFIDRPLWWQVWLTGNEWAGFSRSSRGGSRGRSVSLLNRIANWYRSVRA